MAQEDAGPEAEAASAPPAAPEGEPGQEGYEAPSWECHVKNDEIGTDLRNKEQLKDALMEAMESSGNFSMVLTQHVLYIVLFSCTLWGELRGD